MPKKPVKGKIKVWVLGDSANGYFFKFKVYAGKEKEREQGLGEHVVKTLTKGLKHKHHQLEDLQIYRCGTVRKDRKGLPQKPCLKNR